MSHVLVLLPPFHMAGHIGRNPLFVQAYVCVCAHACVYITLCRSYNILICRCKTSLRVYTHTHSLTRACDKANARRRRLRFPTGSQPAPEHQVQHTHTCTAAAPDQQQQPAHPAHTNTPASNSLSLRSPCTRIHMAYGISRSEATRHDTTHTRTHATKQ